MVEERRIEMLEEGQQRQGDEIKRLQMTTSEIGTLVRTQIAVIHEDIRDIKKKNDEIACEMKRVLQQAERVNVHTESIRELKERMSLMERRVIYASGAVGALLVIMKLGEPLWRTILG